MKKLILITIGVILIVGFLILWQHSYNEHEKFIWRIRVLEIKEQAYLKKKSIGWSQEETEEYIKREIDRKGLKKPGLCIYCTISSVF